mgnify:CR=1 FL=1
MPQQVVEETALYTMEWDDDLRCVVFTWNDFASGSRFRRGCNALLDEFQRRDTSKAIVDTSSVEAHDESDQAWLQEEWMPEMIDAGAEYVVTITAESVIAEMDMDELLAGLEHLPYEAHMTSSMADARDWIASQ